tara:strand:+ start:663 stop:818 length:156 start_codon:yes stop_codon:yes gene_type:complete
MKKTVFTLAISLSFGQGLDKMDILISDLEETLRNSSRSFQKVFVEDFTGLQ